MVGGSFASPVARHGWPSRGSKSVVEVAGSGADASLDPSSTGWAPVSGGDVLAYLEDGRDRAAELTAVMVGNCIVDGLGLEALELADSLLDNGYAVRVSLENVPNSESKASSMRSV